GISGNHTLDRAGNIINFASFNEAGIEGTCFINGKYFVLIANNDSIDIIDENNALYKRLNMQAEENIEAEGDNTFVKSLIRGSENILINAYPINWKASTTNSTFNFSEGKAILSKDRRYLVMHYENNAYLHDRTSNAFYKLSVDDTAFVSLTTKVIPKNTIGTKGRKFLDIGTILEKESKAVPVQAIAVANSFKYLIYASGDTTKLWDIRGLEKQKNVGSANTSPIKLIGHTGPVNSITISPNDSLILTGGTDNLAMLWNTKGDRKAVLKGHKSKITYTSFSTDGREIITGDDKGHVLIWRLGTDLKPSNLVKFSPFEYHALGLAEKQYDVKKMYDTTTFQKLLAATLHYSASLPYTNVYTGDISYANNVKTALNEVQDLYETLFRKDSFATLPTGYKNTLYTKYTNLIYETPGLTSAGTSLDNSLKNRLNRFYDDRVHALIQGKKSIDHSQLITDLETTAQYFADVKDYKEATIYFNKKVTVFEALQKRKPNAGMYHYDIARTYTSLAYYAVLSSKYSEAIQLSKKAIAADPSYSLAYTNLALAYLFLKNYKEAETIYTTYKEELYYPFMQDLEDLEKEGVITKGNTELYNQVLKIKKLLN
ncbi:MAG TPA: tetratricopeptide repeat protein, partial [Chitinophagaceae bacterium]|nr:tetratricopeptide repeat protein [Chitinophagaceae bacterium]